MTKEEMMEKLISAITPNRYRHTLGVAQTAKRLAPSAGVDPEKAEIAGILHDCAKSMSYKDMLRITEEMRVPTDEIERRISDVLHAPAGAACAMRDYAVTDPEILSAIRFHTIGGKGLTPLETLIYVSDFIEPGRKPFEGLERVRKLAETDIYMAAEECARLSCEYVLSRGGEIHPATYEMFQNTEE